MGMVSTETFTKYKIEVHTILIFNYKTTEWQSIAARLALYPE